jgi:hypothetical protein
MRGTTLEREATAQMAEVLKHMRLPCAMSIRISLGSFALLERFLSRAMEVRNPLS